VRRINTQHDFGGRPLTHEEHKAALSVERKRSRWFWSVMLVAALILSIAVTGMMINYCDARLERAVVRGLGIDPQYDEANYNAYCMIEYHNQLHGTDYDYFSGESRQSISPELEAEMRRAYMMGFLYAPQEERIDFEPELDDEEFDDEIQRMAEAARNKLKPAYERPGYVCVIAGVCLLAFCLLMIVFPGGRRHLNARELTCRGGMLGTSMVFPAIAFRAYLQADELGPEYSKYVRITWWNIMPREMIMVLRSDEIPVLIVMADGQVRFYPVGLLKSVSK